ncbi:MAG: pantoate--beta-alanine ligase [Verrucomicrobiales bacterium]|nr:pantoate--beta-alanine ligase [Verrucomicrobiales bacterium]
MRLITSVGQMQRQAARWRRAGIRIGLVPTMGSLHEGHVSLLRTARRAVRRAGRVVVSIYVNPTQFGPKEDFARYPRDLERDKQLCREAEVDLVFAPADDEMYPASRTNSFSTYVVEERLSRTMEGASRPTHFRGVMTVVAKLFNLVLPDVAVFGAKDFQQAAIVWTMARDLNFPVKIIVAPTVREPDGLALSSRNRYLTREERQQALVLSQALRRAEERVRDASEPIPAGKLQQDLVLFIEQQPSARVDYIEFFDPETFQPALKVGRGTHLALAVFIGQTRLIDNARI